MRRLLTFECNGCTLAGTLDEAGGTSGLLIVTGGSQTRIGSHRMFERLASAVAVQGFPCFRFDRRGVGDSEGEDPGYKGSAPDLAAAAAAFRAHAPHVERVFGFGLCDGATALALFGSEAGVDRLLLANPWFVEAEDGAPPAAAVKRHYRRQLTSLAGWKKILSGSVNYRKVLSGFAKIASPGPADLAAEVATALRRTGTAPGILLCRGDNTAVAAEAVWNSADYRQIREGSAAPIYLDSDSHTFARPGDAEALSEVVLAMLRAQAATEASNSASAR